LLIRKRIPSIVSSVSIAELNGSLPKLGVLDVTTASVLTLKAVGLIVNTLVNELLLRNWNCPFVLPPMLTSKYMLVSPLVKLRRAPSCGICNATPLSAAVPAMNAVTALLVTPVSVPTDVRLLAVTPLASVLPVSVPAAAVIVIAADPSKSTPLMARAVANLVAVAALPLTLPVIVFVTDRLVKVPTLVRLLAVTPLASVLPVSVPAAAVIVMSALPLKLTPLMLRAVVSVGELPVQAVVCVVVSGNVILVVSNVQLTVDPKFGKPLVNEILALPLAALIAVLNGSPGAGVEFIQSILPSMLTPLSVWLALDLVKSRLVVPM
jgi:hypothetical protein